MRTRAISNGLIVLTVALGTPQWSLAQSDTKKSLPDSSDVTKSTEGNKQTNASPKSENMPPQGDADKVSAGEAEHSGNGASGKSAKAAADSAKKDDPSCNKDCAHLCLHNGDKLAAMVGQDGVMFKLPNGTWCSMSTNK